MKGKLLKKTFLVVLENETRTVRLKNSHYTYIQSRIFLTEDPNSKSTADKNVDDCNILENDGTCNNTNSNYLQFDEPSMRLNSIDTSVESTADDLFDLNDQHIDKDDLNSLSSIFSEYFSSCYFILRYRFLFLIIGMRTR